MESKRFTMIDEGFVCTVCGKPVSALGYTARDHCPHCLCSLHLDDLPGDRSADCGAVLKPVGIEKSKKGDFKIIYRCSKCGIVKKNKAAADDDTDLIISLSTNAI